MAEPLSLVSFAIGTVSAVGGVRNLAQRLFEDVDRFRHDHENSTTILNRLQFVFDQLQMWQKCWMIDEETTSDGLLESYWGAGMAPRIRATLETVKEKARNIEKEIKQRYDVSLESIELAVNTKSRWDVLQALQKAPSTGRRFINVIFQDRTFSQHFKDLEDAVDRLKQVSKSQLITAFDLDSEEGWERNVQDTALGHFLKQLRPISALEFHDLQARLAGLRNYSCEYQLSHCTSPLDRLETLKRYANSKLFRYHLLVAQNGATVDRTLLHSFCCHRCGDGDRPSMTVQDIELLFDSGSLDGVINNHSSAVGPSKFRLHHTEKMYERSTSLRAYIKKTSCDHDRWLHGAFTKRQRTQVAYEVAECALLLLTKGLLSNICSCGVGKLQAHGSIGEFTLRLGSVIHHDSEPWCSQRWWEKMPVRRFGILLIEICLGKIVCDAIYNKETKSIEIDFDRDVLEDAEGLDQDTIVNLVRKEAGDDFRDAVEYCLNQDTALDDIDERMLDGFFDHVVLPLWVHYEAEVIDGLRRLQISRRRRREAAQSALT